MAVTLKDGRTAHVFALAHCGTMGTLSRNRKKNTELPQQIEDWMRIVPYIHVQSSNAVQEITMFQDKVIVIIGENICIDGGQARLMIYHDNHGRTI